MKATASLCLLLLTTMLCGQAVAEEYVMFDYQGRVRVANQPFTGNGSFKFSIVTLNGSSTQWSNDGTGGGGSEPVASVPISVSDGLFSVMVGDTALGMEPINNMIFNGTNPLRLRVWFSDGSHGFQRLLPDHVLANLNLRPSVSWDRDTFIYVDGNSGNNDNSGFTTATAKKTIQAAVDMVPPRIRGNVTIKVFAGVYREQVNISGVSGPASLLGSQGVMNGKKLTLLGDEAWTPSSPTDPTVRITGTDQDAAPTRARQYCLVVQQSSAVAVQGIMLDYASVAAVMSENSSSLVSRCKTANSYIGFYESYSSTAVLRDTIANSNTLYGFSATSRGAIFVYNCTAKLNGSYGLDVSTLSSAIVYGGVFSQNGSAGVHGIIQSNIGFFPPGPFEIKNNGEYGIILGWDSLATSLPVADMSGNNLGNSLTFFGSNIY